MIRKLALAVGALLIAYCLYLGWRVATERGRIANRVDSIIAAADPADVTLSPARTAILLLVEDPTFRTNKGLDFSTPGGGMTTISQSLGKRIFFTRFRPGFSKGELVVLTRFALYRKVDKQRTLKAFLATAYFGNRNGRAVIGIGPAARAWFAKPLFELTDREYLSLIAMGPAPRTLDPIRHAAANADRVTRIERMLGGLCQPDGLRDVMLVGCAVKR
ncbi:MAG: transglycosylase domain-containing protein [Sphingomicrobium sp.]